MARDVVVVLEGLTGLDPAPGFIRSDNDTGFIAHALRSWRKDSVTRTDYIEQGPPWQRELPSHMRSARLRLQQSVQGRIPEHQADRHGG